MGRRSQRTATPQSGISVLTIYEKHPTADAYRVGGFYSPYALVATEKRFTGPELAAAHWKARALGWPVTRADALYKFAALPHYDQEPQ